MALFVQKELRSFMYYFLVSYVAKHCFACTGKVELCHIYVNPQKHVRILLWVHYKTRLHADAYKRIS